MPATGNARKQYLAGLCVNIIAISYGAFCVWPSASFLVLQSDESPLETGPMSNSDAGNVGAMLCVGGAVGTITFTWCVDRIGRKGSLLLIALPSLIGWLIIPFARNPTELCVSRFFGGFAGAGIFCVIPIYTTELSENSVRGVLGTFLILSGNVGIVVAFVLGYYFSYSTVAWILISVVLLYLVPLIWLPETPQHLLKKNKIKKAEESLRYFRNVCNKDLQQTQEFERELKKLKDNQDSDNEKRSLTWRDFTNRVNRKALLIGIMLVSLNQLSGQFAMINYTGQIFKTAGSNLSPNMSAIIVGAIQLVGAIVATGLVDKSGRRVLLTISLFGASFAHICLGTYSYLNSLGFDLEDFRWVSLVSFSLILFITCIGIVPLPFLIVSEVMPREIRSKGSMICMICLWCIAFTLLKLLPVMTSVLGLHGIAFFFGGCCFFGGLLILIFLPETKGKSLDEILRMLENS